MKRQPHGANFPTDEKASAIKSIHIKARKGAKYQCCILCDLVPIVNELICLNSSWVCDNIKI